MARTENKFTQSAGEAADYISGISPDSRLEHWEPILKMMTKVSRIDEGFHVKIVQKGLNVKAETYPLEN